MRRKNKPRWQAFEEAVENLLLYYKCSFHKVTNYRCFVCGQVQNAKAKNFPDFFIYHPRVFAVECKTGKGELSKGQEKVKEQMEEAGIKYILLRDTTDDLINFLTEGN